MTALTTKYKIKLKLTVSIERGAAMKSSHAATKMKGSMLDRAKDQRPSFLMFEQNRPRSNPSFKTTVRPETPEMFFRINSFVQFTNLFVQLLVT